MDEHLSLDIFVIEDDPDTCENLRDVLELDDHRVTVATSAAAAFQSPDLATAAVILLDWKLPDASALDILPRLRKAAAYADVIIVTGFGDFERVSSALREGAADYLIKPVNAASLLASIRRVGHRRWLAREKSRSEEMFRSLVQAAPCLILILRPDLSIVYSSPYVEQVTGYTAGEVEGRDFAEVFFGDGNSGDVRRIVDELLRRGEASGKEVQIVCRDGMRRWLVWNARVLPAMDGELTILAVGQDVTEQRRAIDRLVQAERLAAIGEAMAGLAHESRNALQRSQAYLELLVTQLEHQPESIELVGKIQVAQNQLHQLYEEVRQYAAPLRISPVRCDLMTLIDETWSHLERMRSGRMVRLIVDRSLPPAVCSVDHMLIQQVFRNILENSLTACADPVEIHVRQERVTKPGGDSLRVVVRDNGPGLTAEQRSRIFEPFFTTKTRGTGLGMTLAKRIVEAHHGSIMVRTDSESGAEIAIELPL